MKSARYLSFVGQLPCCHCQTDQVGPPHHVIDLGMGIMGGKASDVHSVSLCPKCHHEVHKDAKSFPQARWLMETQNRAFKEGVLKIS